MFDLIIDWARKTYGHNAVQPIYTYNAINIVASDSQHLIIAIIFCCDFYVKLPSVILGEYEIIDYSHPELFELVKSYIDRQIS